MTAYRDRLNRGDYRPKAPSATQVEASTSGPDWADAGWPPGSDPARDEALRTQPEKPKAKKVFKTKRPR